MAVYNNAIEKMLNAYATGGSAPSGTLKAALMTTSYTYDETDVYFSDLTGEASGTGYTTGGQAVDSVTVTQDDANNGAYLDFANETFSGISVTNVDAYVLYWDTGTPSTSELFMYVPFTEGAQTITTGSITITPPAGGALLIAN